MQSKAVDTWTGPMRKWLPDALEKLMMHDERATGGYGNTWPSEGFPCNTPLDKAYECSFHSHAPENGPLPDPPASFNH
jgi:hypothetical protein